MEVVRDKADNCDHRLLDRERRPDGRAHRRLDHRRPGPDADRQGIPDHAQRRIAVLREIGVETGGSNVQWAIEPEDGRMVVIEMNPRVSRSSALASKATGFPDCQGRGQAGRRLHAGRAGQRHHQGHARQLRADHRLCRHQDPALRLREVPRRRAALTTAMKSVGEAMAIGRTFQESLQKALRSTGNRPDRL